MKVRLAPDFIGDLRNALNQDFVQRVLDSVLDSNGQFRTDRNDHRYTGIEGAWIRYGSQGKSAYRVIYIRSKDTVTLYRAGIHSIEDRLVSPTLPDSLPEIDNIALTYEQPPPSVDFGTLLSTSKPMFFRHAILQMFHCGHKEIVLVSPFVSFKLLSRHHYFGRFLDKAIEENTVTFLITRPPTDIDLRDFEELEARGICVFFHKSLHAKLYLFDVDPIAQGARDVPLARTAILGSANLTDAGFGLEAEINEQLCFRIPSYKYDDARDYVDWVLRSSTEFVRFKSTVARRF